MTDFRVNTRAIQDSYLKHDEPLTLHPTALWGKAGESGAVTTTFDRADVGTRRVVEVVKRFVEARLMGEHRELVEHISKDCLWDGPPITLSNKGHLRVAKYLSNFFAQAELHPNLVTVSPVGPDRHLVQFDAVLINHPTRVWWIPATLLLPASIKYSTTFKVGVRGPLETGKIEMVIGRITNLPALFPRFIRQYFGLLFGAIPHNLEGVWGYLVDLTGDDYYKRKREARFAQRHPNSQNPLVDTVVDMASDTLDWARGNAYTAWDTARVLSEGYITTALNTATWAAQTAMQIVEGGVRTASATAGKVAGTAAGAADVVADYGKVAVDTGVRTAANVAGAAYGTATHVAGAAYDTAANVAGTAVDTGARVAGAAVDTAANAASTVAGTAAGAANAAYTTGAQAADAAYNTASTAANTAYNAGSRAADAAYTTGARAADTAYTTAADVTTKTYDTTVGVTNSAYAAAMDTAARAAGAVKETAATAEAKADKEKRKGAAAAPAGFETHVTYTAPSLRGQ